MLPLNVTPFQLPDRYCQVDEKLAVPAMAVGSRAGAVLRRRGLSVSPRFLCGSGSLAAP